MLQAFTTGVFDLLAPPRCAGCDTFVETRLPGFCEACHPLIEPWARDQSAACEYGGPLRDAIQRFKFDGAPELAPALAALLAAPAKALLGQVDMVVPVPLHARRLRLRGFNQSALLALPVARWLGVPLSLHALRRLRDTPSQLELTRRERRAQLRGAFAASKKVRGRAVLVIDDVRTTGATLDEVQHTLERAEASAVFTLTLAGVPPHEDGEAERTSPL